MCHQNILFDPAAAAPESKVVVADVDPPEIGRPTFGMKLHYALDNQMVKPWSSFLLIGIMALIIVIVGGVFNVVSDAESTYAEGCWLTWKYLMDPSAHADAGGMARIPGVVLSLIGLFVMAMLLGFVFDLITVNMDELRKGKSIVVEKEHTLILGWSEKLFTILEEICDANESRPDGTTGAPIVILSDTLDKETMEAELADRIEDRKGSRIICRTGSPMIGGDLMKVAAPSARNVIVLCEDEGNASRADSAVLRVVLSLTSLLTAASEAHIVAEIRDIDSDPLLGLVGQDRVETVVSHDIIGRLMVMGVRQPGLTMVYDAILGFEGDEFYMEEWPEAVGLPFRVLPEHFIDAIPIGIKTADGVVLLKPNMDRPVEAGEEIVVIAEDDDTYSFQQSTCEVPEGPPKNPQSRSPERMLLIGWRRDVRDMFKLIDELVAPGSEIHVYAPLDVDSRNNQLIEEGFSPEDDLQCCKLIHHVGNARRYLEMAFKTLPDGLEFTSCLICADEDSEDDPMHSDSQCISNLLLFRDIQMKAKAMDGRSAEDLARMAKACPVLCEILDPRTQDSIATSAALKNISDFVQSNKMVSRVIAMVSEERSVNTILDEMMGGSGAGLELKSAELYMHPQEQLSFLQLCKRCHDCNEVLLGYQTLPVADPENTIINPRNKLESKDWSNIQLIVLAGPPLHPKLHDGSAGASAMSIGVLGRS